MSKLQKIPCDCWLNCGTCYCDYSEASEEDRIKLERQQNAIKKQKARKSKSR